ncbi:hypothetical protein F750_6286 [Streptomyces sp. PAMC 26508]|nr:hypothetical protein F750_6286 [Streptomyces sp. PAMC 26508]
MRSRAAKMTTVPAGALVVGGGHECVAPCDGRPSVTRERPGPRCTDAPGPGRSRSRGGANAAAVREAVAGVLPLWT